MEGVGRAMMENFFKEIAVRIDFHRFFKVSSAPFCC